MHCRFLHLTTNYPDYLRSFYELRPGLALYDYDSQRKQLMEDAFGWADFWSVAMRGLGWEADEVIANVEPMQAQWAWENGIEFGVDWQIAIAIEQIKAFDPEVLFISDFATFDADFVRRLREEVSGIRLILGWCGAPYSDPSVFAEYDVVLSNIPELVANFSDRGHEAYLIRHAFEPRVLNKIGSSDSASHDFVFTGSVGACHSAHGGRAILLAGLLDVSPLEIYARVSTPDLWSRATDACWLAFRQATKLISPQQRSPGRLSWKQEDSLIRSCRPPCYGLEMFQLLHDSKVSFNSHIDISRGSASNMRLFEATGVGSCLLTDSKANLDEMFDVDREVVTYRTIDECTEKIKWLVDNDNERVKIAEAGQRRTLKDHTFARRAEQIHEIVERKLRGSMGNPSGRRVSRILSC